MIKTLPIKDYRKINEKADKITSEGLSNLFNGIISLKEFLKLTNPIDLELSRLSAICTSSFEKYASFFKKLDLIPKYVGVLDHEKQHATIALDYGLDPRFCLMMGCDKQISTSPEGVVTSCKRYVGEEIFYSPFIIDDLSNAQENWTLSKFKKYLNDLTGNLQNPSSTDKLINKLANQ